MKVSGKFDHFNIDVKNLEKSISFYEKALGLKEISRKVAKDDSFILVYMGEDESDFLLELTWLKSHAGKAFELGENESHLCIRVNEDYSKVKKYHLDMGYVCYENEEMGLYFIEDPDGYWIEILPKKSFTL